MTRCSLLSPLLLVTLASALFAQAPANWDVVKKIDAGKQIRVRLADGRSVRGEFESATDDAVIVSTTKSQETLPRTTIAKVSSKGKSHRLRNTLIGLGAGAGAGLIFGSVADSECANEGCFFGKSFGKELFTPAGALIGVLIGAVIPTGRWRDVYRAAKPII